MERIGRYEVIREVGRGGMAIVYQARDTTLDRIVAVKLIRSDIFGSAAFGQIRERFEREARALAKLNHPNIVKVLDYGEHEKAPFLVMEYLKGATLKEVKKPIRVETAVRLLRPIAEALDYIHKQGILHRDVKPSNIMLVDGKTPMLTDFGIAKWIEDETDGRSLTGTGVGIGTPEYMAPEQGLGKQVDGRADMYSLTIAFYELITGQKPFRGDTALAILMKQATEPIPDPRTVVPELSESVMRFLDQALAKDPEDRYPTFADYLRDLDGLGLQAMANRARGTLTGIQTSPASAPQTDSSVRIGSTDLRKLRAGAKTGRKMGAVLTGVLLIGVIVLGVIGYLSVQKIRQDQISSTQTAEVVAAIESLAAIETRTEAENRAATATAEAIAALARATEVRRTVDAVFARAYANVTATENSKYIATADANLTVMANTVAAAGTANAQLTFTANAIATKFAMPTNTPIPPTQTPTPTRTRIPTKTSTPTRTPKPSATAVVSADFKKVNTIINRMIVQRNIDANAGSTIWGWEYALEEEYENALSELDTVLPLLPKVSVPTSGTLKHTEDGYISLEKPNSLKNIKDFILKIEFTNPWDSYYHQFDYGIRFRDDNSELLNLVIFSKEHLTWWELSDKDWETKQEGWLPLQVGEKQTNSIILIVRYDIGLFYINKKFVASLDLSSVSGSGSISIGTGFYNDSKMNGYSTEYKNLSVYTIENIDENCKQLNADLISFYGVGLKDVPDYTNLTAIQGGIVVFDLPDDAIESDWEIEITDDYTWEGQQKQKKGIGFVRYSCSKVDKRIHCGPLLLPKKWSGEIRIFPKGLPCVVDRSGIPIHMLDQTWQSLSGY